MRAILRGTALLLLLGSIGGVCAQTSGGKDYAVVASPDVPISDVSLGELRKLFEFERRFWSTREPVTILFTEANLSSGSFLLERIYRRSYPELRRLILEKLYQGQLDLAPKVVGSDSAALDFLAAGQGLLAIVEARSVGTRRVLVLTVEGKAPGSEGYPLRR